MVQRLFQDPAGTIPAILPGQPVGLIKRLAGTLDATQATALSKPTLARWPWDGVRNIATGAQAVSNSLYWPTSRVDNGITVTRETTGLTPGGVPFAENRFLGTALAAGVKAAFSSNQNRFAVAQGQAFVARALATLLSGFSSNQDGVRLDIAGFNAAGSQVFTRSSELLFEVGVEKELVVSWVVSDPAVVSMGIALGHRSSSGIPVDARMRASGIMIERGAAQTPLQFNYGPNDITEPGVKDLWHLYNDGGDSLDITIPPGVWGVANLAIDRSYRIESISFNEGGMITTLLGERQIDCIYRRGAWSPAEILAIQQYWERMYG